MSPVEVFSPKGLEFPIVYDWGSAGTVPIPEFRVYAQQFLGLLAVILSTHTLITAENALTVKCWVENTCQRLDLILWVDLHLPRDSPGLAEHERTLHSIGMTMSWALRKLFSDLKPIFWDFGPDKDRFKLWVEYPGNMTVAGFVRALTQPNMLFGAKAQLELTGLTEEQQCRAATLLEFILVDQDEGKSDQ